MKTPMRLFQPSSSSPFPLWLRRLDPLLEGAETNAIYEAFRLRRTTHHRSLRRYLRFRTVTAPLAVALGAAVVVLFLAFPLVARAIGLGTARRVLFAFVVIASLAVLAAFTWQLIRRGMRGARRLPDRLADVFGPGTTAIEPAVDVWLSGATGSEILEAIYLERRERFRATAALEILGLLFVIWLYVRHSGVLLLSLAMGLLVVAVLYFCWELVLASCVMHIEKVRRDQLVPRLIGWGSWGTFQGVSRNLGWSLLRAGGWFVVLIGAMCCIGFVGRTIVDANLKPTATQIMYFVSALLAVVGVTMRFMRGYLRDTYVARVRKSLQEANDAYGRFVTRQLLGDFDG